jgi:hypothetical protein
LSTLTPHRRARLLDVEDVEEAVRDAAGTAATSSTVGAGSAGVLKEIHLSHWKVAKLDRLALG